jgi:hypothetical protein
MSDSITIKLCHYLKISQLLKLRLANHSLMEKFGVRGTAAIVNTHHRINELSVPSLNMKNS